MFKRFNVWLNQRRIKNREKILSNIPKYALLLSLILAFGVFGGIFMIFNIVGVSFKEFYIAVILILAYRNWKWLSNLYKDALYIELSKESDKK